MIHTVTFNPNNGESNIVVEVKHNDKVSKPFTPSYDGHTFGGWFGKINYNGTNYYFDQNIIKNNANILPENIPTLFKTSLAEFDLN